MILTGLKLGLKTIKMKEALKIIWDYFLSIVEFMFGNERDYESPIEKDRIEEYKKLKQAEWEAKNLTV